MQEQRTQNIWCRFEEAPGRQKNKFEILMFQIWILIESQIPYLYFNFENFESFMVSQRMVKMRFFRNLFSVYVSPSTRTQR